MSKIIIIGCGIGGATAALALTRFGHDVRVFERAPFIAEAGAGIGLLPNAMRALDALSLGEQIRSQGQEFQTAHLYDEHSHLLKTIKLAEIVGPDFPAGVVIHRAKLLAIIMAELAPQVVVSGVECIGFNQTKGAATVYFKGRAEEKADLVIGADGIHSVIRKKLFGDSALRYSGQTCFRGIAPHSFGEPGVIPELWGSGKRGSVMGVDSDRVYWWTAINAEPGKYLSANERKKLLLGKFSDWPFDLAKSIRLTPPENILQNDLVDRLPLSTWTKGRVSLLGDAAHPMQPNLGQGACTSIEDAVALANALVIHGDDLSAALLAYEHARIKRTSMISNLSWLYGIPCLWQGSLAVATRRLLIKSMPDFLTTSLFRKILAHDVTKTFSLRGPQFSPFAQ
jgi:2-polyprenyl-6-methoxyphenol hydroxylase-like FAD-dependent oxidoreductase